MNASDEFAVVYPGLLALAHRVAYRILGSGDSADVAQETLTRCFVHWHKLGRRDGLEGWVAVTSGRLAIDVLRRVRRARTAGDALAPGDGATADIANTVALRTDLQRALAVLPARQRDVAVLRYVADLTEADTAAALAISVGSVKKHAARALERLSATLSDPPPAITTVAIP